MIAPDVRIFEARPLEYAPQSATQYDLPGHVGVELMGNFQSQRPSAAQLKSNRMMQQRILFQALAVLVVVVLLFAAGRT